MLNKLSVPRPGEKTADPFCGYGSIPAARLRHFPPGEFFASDIDPAALKYSKNKLKGKAHCVFNQSDVRDLPRLIPPAGLDSIVTDPPWGFYEEKLRLAKSRGPGQRPEQSPGREPVPRKSPGTGPLPSRGEFYTQCLKVFSVLLKPGGRAVILNGRGDELNKAAEENHFTLTRQIPILLSGKKAAIFVLEMPAPS
jgi:tRNA G10  N-methylase Trm11